MSSDDAEYYRGRAAVERVLAREAANPYARRAHRELADNYELLWRLLCADSLGSHRPRKRTAKSVEFATLIQILATPRPGSLIGIPGGSFNVALFEMSRFAQPDRRRRPALFLNDNATTAR